ncbi:hypothetical protein Tco_0850671 [Tanacetum coccineum]
MYPARASRAVCSKKKEKGTKKSKAMNLEKNRAKTPENDEDTMVENNLLPHFKVSKSVLHTTGSDQEASFSTTSSELISSSTLIDVSSSNHSLIYASIRSSRSNYGLRDDDAPCSSTAYSMLVCSKLKALKVEKIGSMLLHVMKWF